MQEFKILPCFDRGNYSKIDHCLALLTSIYNFYRETNRKVKKTWFFCTFKKYKRGEGNGAETRGNKK